METDLSHLVDRIMEISEKRGFETEVFVSEGKHFSSELEGENLDSVEESEDFGIGVRVLKDKKMGFAYSSKKDYEVIYKAMENLINDEYTSFSGNDTYKTPKGMFYKDVVNLTEKELMNALFEMSEILKENKITTVNGGVSNSYDYNRIVNSNGVDIEEENTFYSASIAGINNGETAYDYLTRHDSFNVKELAENVVEFLKNPNAVRTEFTGNIVLDQRALNSLLSYTLLPAFNAENIQRNRSVLKDKMGEEIFGEKITIEDDGTLDYALYSSAVDGEGIKTQKTVLVENGILKNYLYDIKRANIDGCNSTGNGSRGYSSLPTVSPSNIVVKPVEKQGSFNEYLYINTLIGTHTANPVTGDFSVEISNSYIVKNDEKTPVKKGLLSGNIFEILKTATPLDKVCQRGKLISPPLLFEGKILI
ncbi:peptidase U62 modulator of DNA gyrase [Methanococcus vannielii SB]|uniref:Peptidase U62 modulator of DNA gyrase n=1 Tax=Methanococcus vannielii (strain ATCC 35089 / DSM 1224 / JCM 13029 / OCM 148 / SB) TaxID=406327 RepID=A6UQH2_METVS|nr:TldD/PmbA family protein [Methanococcus vannielii]ABR54744.1 peptidase U62 modulator of DNA gyrase [Methanococcus vannielii SB]